jgi:hypothetical protein
MLRGRPAANACYVVPVTYRKEQMLACCGLTDTKYLKEISHGF